MFNMPAAVGPAQVQGARARRRWAAHHTLGDRLLLQP